jgi:hypothetical protein
MLLPQVSSLLSVRFSLPLSIALCLTGCSDQLPTYPVNGHVFFPGGSPVHVGTVELKSREHGIQARGTINEDGSFKLTTYKEGDGAIAGVHDCVVVQFIVAEGLSGHKPSTLGVIQRRYGSYATSGLSVEIKPNKSNNVTIEVEGIRKDQNDEKGHGHN